MLRDIRSNSIDEGELSFIKHMIYINQKYFDIINCNASFSYLKFFNKHIKCNSAYEYITYKTYNVSSYKTIIYRMIEF